jgi:glycosyltransferase involved in cell wall biosynthesis
MWRLGRQFLREKYIVGCWAWELPRMPSDWRHGVPFVHEILVPSTFTGEAVSTIADGKRVRVVPLPVAVRDVRQHDGRSGDRPFTVLTAFNAASSIVRKNPAASVTAFRRAFGDDANARLIVKASNFSAGATGRDELIAAIGDANNISIVDKIMEADELDQLFAASDAIISLHRSEGFGLIVAEAMLRSIPAVGTDWSSTTDFLSTETGIPVGYKLIPSHDPQGTYDHPDMTWADADVDDAAAALRRLRDHPALAARLGKAGREFAEQHWTSAEFAKSVLAYLDAKG